MKTRAVLSSAVLVLATLTGCSVLRGDPPDETIVVSGYPLRWAVEQIAGTHFRVVDLVKAGAEPHDAEIGVKDNATLTEARLIVHARGLSPAVDEAVDASGTPDERTVEAFDVLGTNPPAMGGARPVRVIDGDPHFWLDPRALATLAEEVKNRLIDLDPDHAEDYRTSYADLFADLNSLDGRMAVGLDDCVRRTVVVSHDAFAYLGYRYDLDLEAINGLTPGAEPSPAHIAELQDLIRSDGITTVFTEELASPDLAESIAKDLGLRTVVLDPIEGLTDRTKDEDYLSLMDQNLDALREANQCR